MLFLLNQVEKLTEGKEDDTDSGLLECRVVAGAPREWLCAYIPLVVGLYEVRIFTAAGPLPGSPFSVKVSRQMGYFNKSLLLVRKLDCQKILDTYFCFCQ